MFRNHAGKDAAANIEFCGQAHESGLRGRNKVIKNAVGHGLMESTLVAIGPDIQFEAFELDAPLVCDVIEVERGKIRLAGLRAQAGKLRNLHANQKIALRIRIREGFETGVGFLRHLFA